MTEEEAAAWIAGWPERWRTETGAGWAVVEAGTVVGQISLREVDLVDGLGEVSYWVLPAFRGRGFAGRALSAMTAWCFGTFGLHRIDVLHSTRNPASCRVAERAGYLLEGTRHSCVRHADGWHDMHVHARLASGAMRGRVSDGAVGVPGSP